MTSTHYYGWLGLLTLVAVITFVLVALWTRNLLLSFSAASLTSGAFHSLAVQGFRSTGVQR